MAKALWGLAILLSASLSFGAVAPIAQPKVGLIKLKQLIGQSDVIVIGVVIATDNGVGRVEVRSKLKGPPTLPRELTYRARPTWPCDTSRAVLDEQCMLFLKRDAATAGYELAHSGRGRLPIASSEGRVWVSYSEIIMPAKLRRPPHVDSSEVPKRSVLLSGLQAEVERIVRGAKGV